VSQPGSALRGSIAVIMPTYNRGALMRPAIESVLAQTRPAAEIIVVSDGAPIDPAEFIGDLIESGKVRLLRQANAGAPTARHFGANSATSDYLIFFDDDDTLRPDALERLGGLLDRRPECVAAAGGTCFVSRPGAPVWLPEPAPADHYFDKLLDGNEFLGGATMMRREAYFGCGGFEHDIHTIEDWYLNLRLAWLGPIAIHPGVVIEYVEAAGSITSRLAQLDYAVTTASRIATMVGPGGHKAGNRIRAFLYRMYLDRLLTQIGADLRTLQLRAAGRKSWRIFKPLFLPMPSRLVLGAWLTIFAHHFLPDWLWHEVHLPVRLRA